MFAEDHKKCRDIGAGRAVREWCRQHMTDEGDIQINLLPWKSAPTPLFRVHPDNTITFIASVEQVVGASVSLSHSLVRLVPFNFTRWRKGMYRIGGEMVAAKYGRAKRHWLANEARQYFKGIRFDMATGECLNPMPDTTRNVIPEKRTEWLRCLRRYKKGLKARIKVGALTEYADLAMEVRNEKGNGHRSGATHWTEEKFGFLLFCMRENEYPPSILTDFVRSVPRSWRQQEINPTDMMKAVEQVFTTHSQTLREQYGVFGEVLHKKE